MCFQSFIKGLLTIHPLKYVLAKVHLVFRKSYGSSHALFASLKIGKKIDEDYLVAAVLTDLLEAIDRIQSVFEITLSGVPQGSIPEPLLFNIFLNYLFLFIKISDLYNTVFAFCKDLDQLVHIVREESESASTWFHSGNLIVSLGKFQAFIEN